MEPLAKIIFDKMVKAALGRLFAKFPFLGWGPIGWFVSFIVQKYAEEFYEETKLHIKLAEIAAVNAVAEKAHTEADVELKQIAETKGVDSPEYKEKRIEAHNRLADLVKFH